MSRACGKHEGKRNACRNLVEKHERNNHVKAIDVDVGMLSNETKRSTLICVAPCIFVILVNFVANKCTNL
jgi:hypothetical protein